MVSPIAIRKALSGVEHPAGEEAIVAHAGRNGGGGEALEETGDREYEGPSGVRSAVFD